MTIQAPLSSLEEIKKLVHAGADEFYCGIVPIEWKKRYGFEIPLNCRSTYTWANFNTIEELADAVETAHKYGKPVIVTLNETSYNSTQIKIILNMLDQMQAINIDGIIVADLPLLLKIQEKGYQFNTLALSAEANCTSSEAVEFYKNLGITRIIFPRNISIKEISTIIEDNKDLEYEVFFLNEGCFFNGGYCYGIHNVCYSPLCRTATYKLQSYKINDEELFQKSQIESIIKYNAIAFIKYNRTYITKCALCSLKLLKEISVECLKVVGRTGNIVEKVKWVQIAKKAVEMAEEIIDYDEYKQACKKIFLGNNQKEICDNSLTCYYPNEYNFKDIDR